MIENVEPITFVGTEYASERIAHLQRKREIAAQSEASVRLSGGALSDAAHAMLWVDFNDIDDQRRVSGLLKFAEDQSAVVVNARLQVGDDDGNVCMAQVLEIRPSGVVLLALEMDTFNTVEARCLATAR